ncbi:acyl-CoA thioesterase [Platysternon megacephalum]|uniref:Acyl-CoA thioesterase n=1 Tax=Platysternon megacephalum TaxID=55544 RepID=A0A4D9DGM8_9SAUR|nr:acyl-CoA thioesterase [Platysternon megacephalum]
MPPPHTHTHTRGWLWKMVQQDGRWHTGRRHGGQGTTMGRKGQWVAHPYGLVGLGTSPPPPPHTILPAGYLAPIMGVPAQLPILPPAPVAPLREGWDSAKRAEGSMSSSRPHWGDRDYPRSAPRAHPAGYPAFSLPPPPPIRPMGPSTLVSLLPETSGPIMPPHCAIFPFLTSQLSTCPGACGRGVPESFSQLAWLQLPFPM